MLKFITTLTVFLFGILAKGQNTETRTITNFDKLEIKNATVIYTESDRSSLTIESEYNDTPHPKQTIMTEIANGTLKIKGIDADSSTIVYVSGKASDFKLGSKAQCTATNLITVPNARITLQSGSVFNGSLVNQNTTITGGKNCLFKGAVHTGRLNADFGSNARVILCGSAQTASIIAENSALCHARNFASRSMQVSAAGNSKVTVYTNENIGIKVIENANVTYNGVPKQLQLNENAVCQSKIKTPPAVTYNY